LKLRQEEELQKLEARLAAARSLKLRQEEELQKLKARLAKSRAREAGARRTPTPIPVANALGHGVGISREGSHDSFGDPLADHVDSVVDGASAAAVGDSGEELHGSEDDSDCDIQPQRGTPRLWHGIQ